MTGDEEARGVAAICNHLIRQEGVEPGKVMILLRSNRNRAYSTPVATALRSYGLPVEEDVKEGTVLDKKSGRTLLAVLRLLSNPADHLAWRTVLSLTRGIGPRSIKPIYNFAIAQGIDFSQSLARVKEYSSEFRPNALGLVLQVTANIRGLIDRYTPLLPSDEGKVSDLLDLVRQVAEEIVSEEEDRDEVLSFLLAISLSIGRPILEDLFTALVTADEEQESDPSESKISILTMHQAKGLTADSVFIYGYGGPTFTSE